MFLMFGMGFDKGWCLGGFRWPLADEWLGSGLVYRGLAKALFFEKVGHDFGELQVAFSVGVDLVGTQAAVA